jgi:hypothetical protein
MMEQIQEALNQKNYKIFFLRDHGGCRIACIVSEKYGDVVRFALAMCHPKDIFRPKEGRQLAFERLVAFDNSRHKYTTTGTVVQSSIRGRAGIKADILELVMTDRTLPMRIRRVALYQAIELLNRRFHFAHRRSAGARGGTK